MCLAQSVLTALKEGFEVYFVSDCSAGGTQEAHDDAKVRMTMAGAKPINWIAVTAEWAPDYRSPERASVAEVWMQRGGAPAMLTDFVMAQVKAGLVPLPESLRSLAGVKS